ncbi:hypothetical protein CES86_3931 [Brucella lupini]|uniref:Uncharacterized protein n=1 Tax=Brucella lupini TaxID=255457 RepID=A0A256GH54_9HYPH|nr:hypothetical protein CES86_3931 [Brucella lupini]
MEPKCGCGSSFYQFLIRVKERGRQTGFAEAFVGLNWIG